MQGIVRSLGTLNSTAHHVKSFAKFASIAIAGLIAFLAGSTRADAVTSDLLIAKCIYQSTCWYSQTPTPWSKTLTSADLKKLGLGKTVTLQAVQRSYYVIRLGATVITFTTPDGPVSQRLPEFNGSYYSGFCNPCEIDNVGEIAIPKKATSATISGTFGNSAVPNTAAVDLSLLPGGVSIDVARVSLTIVEAIGAPRGGVFSYPAPTAAGGAPSTIAFAPGFNQNSNPHYAVLTAPAGGGSPTPGSLTTFTAVYTAASKPAKASFKIPAFGMSCYIVALESDYGAPPNGCTSLTYKGKKISGTVTDPNGLTGTYCASFIFNITLQGSAKLNDGRFVQYDVKSKKINVVASITGHDGTPVVAGQTVARDLAIIKPKGVKVDVNTVANGLLANDTGGAIKGYRFDLFNGFGTAACSSFMNRIAIAACQTPQPKCPGASLQ